ncbi:MAG TPA: TonB family protein [Polyangiaceae bacterium]|nr:TonB family protein [Polyangiaceae bacterium]
MLESPKLYFISKCSAFVTSRKNAWRWVTIVLALSVVTKAAAQVPAPASLESREAPVTPPAVVTRVDAAYPPEALAARQEGTVTLLVTIGVDGTVMDATVAESGGDRFDGAALAAVKQWKFTPARRADTPIESRIRVPFRFALPAVETAPPPVTVAPATPAAPAPEATPPAPKPTTRPPSPPEAAIDVTVRGRSRPPSRGASDYQIEVGGLATVPRQNAAEMLKLAPGILLTNEGGEGHAEQVFLRGFDAREGQDIEFTVDGVPINESGNLHGNGYSDTHFIIPELVDSLRVVEGPFDPRQGNYAVAGSADYHLGLALRGITAKFTAGSYGTYRELVTYGPPGGSPGTFAAGELYQTSGFGQNRDGRRGTVMAQYEANAGASTTYRLAATAYSASFHTAGVLRDDDYRAGRVGFYDTYDPLQGEDSSRYSVSGEIETHTGNIVTRNQLFAIARPLRIRENFTGFLLDVQEPQQDPHPQRGDLIDLHNQAWTIGAKGAAHAAQAVLGQRQEFEVGYFARGDFVSSMQQRIEAATGHPYHTDVDLDSTLGDFGLYADANLRFTRWLSVRGGVRGDVFTFDLNDKCAVQSVEHPSMTNPPDDQSCLSQQNFGAYRDPNQRVSTASTAYMPRGSLIVGPFYGVSASASIGKGVRSIDPIYVAQDVNTPFASVVAYEGGLSYEHRFASGIDVGARSVVFDTHVDHDLIFSQTAGRNTLAGPTTRLGSASSARLTGGFYDVAANLTYVHATFDDTHLLIPYVPDLVLRVDNAFFGDLPWWTLAGHALRASFATGVTYVGPRPLPYDTRSDTIFTIDNNLTVGWSFVDLSLSIQNLLDSRYRLGEYNYASDFHSQAFPTLVPVRHFSAGAPRIILFSIALNYGGGR